MTSPIKFNPFEIAKNSPLSAVAPHVLRNKNVRFGLVAIVFTLLLFIFMSTASYAVPNPSPDTKKSLNEVTVSFHSSGSASQEKSLTGATVTHKKKRAFVSFIQDSTSYTPGAIALGHSIRKNSGYYGDNIPKQDQPDMLLLAFESFNNTELLSKLRAVGWTIKYVQPIKPFKEGYFERFQHQYTKLLLWNMTEYSSLLYVDADCIMKGNVHGIFDTVEDKSGWSFGVVGDVWPDRFDLDFNAGVMLIRPNTTVYNDILSVGPKMDYSASNAEQALLNRYYMHRFIRLPYIFNLNLVMVNDHREIWDKLWPDARIIHYTMCKPFLDSCDDYKQPSEYYHEIYKDAVRLIEASTKGKHT